MHISQIIKTDIANGPGIRLSVFVSGCRLHCKGCFQPKTWNFEYGEPYEKLKQTIVDETSRPIYQGITILGGEPFEPENQPYVLDIIESVYKANPSLDIWIYTGNDVDALLLDESPYKTEYTDDILRHTNVLVAGPFVESLKQPGLLFRGSSNQRLIDVQKSLKTDFKKIIDWTR